jgi:hypothetical protein
VNEKSGLSGEIVLTCTAEDGTVRWTETIKNLITDVGDNYYAQRALSAVLPEAPADATKVTCMKLGTGTTAVAKNGAGAGIVTYETGSNAAFSSVSRTNNAIVYNASWGAGVATETALAEIAICTTNADSTSAAADCIARALISPTRNKQAADTLTAAWTHTFLGAS